MLNIIYLFVDIGVGILNFLFVGGLNGVGFGDCFTFQIPSVVFAVSQV